MRKLTLISISSLFFFTGCSAGSSLTDQQTHSIGMVGGLVEGCYQKGLITPNDYNYARNVYSGIINESQKYIPAITASYNETLRYVDQIDYNLCQTELPNTLSLIYQHYENNRLTFTDILVGLNEVSDSYQNHANQMLQATSNNMYYPQPTFNSNPRKKTITANQIGNGTYFSDGSSSMRIGDQVMHSDGSSSTIIGNSAYHSDGSSSMRIGDTIQNSSGSNCYVSGRTLQCN